MLSVYVLAAAAAHALIPVLGLLVHTVMKTLQKLQLATVHLTHTENTEDIQQELRQKSGSQCLNSLVCPGEFPDLDVLQVLDVGRVIAIPLTSFEHSESAAAHGFNVRSPVRQPLHVEDLQHTAVVGETEEHVQL